MGKTMFASELATRFLENRPDSLVGLVFFNFKDLTSHDPTLLLKSIVYQIAKSCPSISSDLLIALEGSKERTIQGIFDGYLMKALELLAAQRGSQKKHLIIFDALDECGLEGSEARKEVLKLFTSKFLQVPGLKLFVTGRPENDIKAALRDFAHEIEEDDERHLKDLKEYIDFSVRDVFECLVRDTSDEDLVEKDALIK